MTRGLGFLLAKRGRGRLHWGQARGPSVNRGDQADRRGMMAELDNLIDPTFGLHPAVFEFAFDDHPIVGITLAGDELQSNGICHLEVLGVAVALADRCDEAVAVEETKHTDS